LKQKASECGWDDDIVKSDIFGNIKQSSNLKLIVWFYIDSTGEKEPRESDETFFKDPDNYSPNSERKIILKAAIFILIAPDYLDW